MVKKLFRKKRPLLKYEARPLRLTQFGVLAAAVFYRLPSRNGENIFFVIGLAVCCYKDIEKNRRSLNTYEDTLSGISQNYETSGKR